MSMVNEHDIRPLLVGFDAGAVQVLARADGARGVRYGRIRQGAIYVDIPDETAWRRSGRTQDNLKQQPDIALVSAQYWRTPTNKDGIRPQPVKSSSNKRIDGMVSLLNAWTCYTNHEDEYIRYLR